jgi:hypothetical protein
MVRMLVRVGFVTVTTVIGNYLGGLIGVVIAAIIATVVVTQTEDVVRVFKQSIATGATAAQSVYLLVKAVVVNPFFKRFARNATIGFSAGLATMLGHYVAGVVGAIISASLVVTAGQSLASGSWWGQSSLGHPQDASHPVVGGSESIVDQQTQMNVDHPYGTTGGLEPPELMS